MSRGPGLRVRLALFRATGFWRLMAPLRALVARHEGLGRWVDKRALPRVQSLLELARGDAVTRYRAWIAAYDSLRDADLATIRAEHARSADPPLLSLVVPVARSDDAMVARLAEDLLAQAWEHWELCVAGEPPELGSSDSLQALFEDPRFRSLPGPASSRAEAWNGALRAAAGEFAVLVDPSVSLRPHALSLLAREIELHPDATLVYADEDVVGEDGARSDHWFKPDWNEALFLSQNYFGGLVAFRRALALEVGGCREEDEDDHAWGLFLRMTSGAVPETVHHLPFVLSHRRATPPVEAIARDRIAIAHQERVTLTGLRADVTPVGRSSYRLHHPLPAQPPTVSVVVPTTGRPELLGPCVDGVLDRTAYPELEVLLVVNEIQREVPDRRDYLDSVGGRRGLRVLYHDDRTFNYSWANNWAVTQAAGELVCFLNDDTEVIGADWLSEMVGHVLLDRVAAVGAMLLYSDDTIQHAGVVLGVGGLAGHAFKDCPRGIDGYHDRATVAQDVSCVTAACMLVRRDVFLGVGAFDETLATAFNDVDLCLRVREAGWRIVWTPTAQLYHRESVSIGRHDLGERNTQWKRDWTLMQRRWRAELGSDPHYSPNLSLDALQVWDPAFPPRVAYPWRKAPAGRARARTSPRG